MATIAAESRSGSGKTARRRVKLRFEAKQFYQMSKETNYKKDKLNKKKTSFWGTRNVSLFRFAVLRCRSTSERRNTRSYPNVENARTLACNLKVMKSSTLWTTISLRLERAYLCKFVSQRIFDKCHSDRNTLRLRNIVTNATRFGFARILRILKILESARNAWKSAV
jgi:hypothetical protein